MKSRNSLAIVISAFGFALVMCGMARANLVMNGGFESYTGVAPKNFIYTVLPTDWTCNGYAFLDAAGTADDIFSPGVPVYPPFPATSPNNGNFVEADGSAGLSQPLTQTVNSLTVGDSYSLSFYQAAGQQVNDLGATTEQWQVSLGSDTQLSALMSILQGGVFPWESQTMSFTASSTSEVLSFLAIGAGGNPPMVFLDGVDMETSVPEPSAAVLLVGVGAVIAIGRLGRRLRVHRTTAAV